MESTRTPVCRVLLAPGLPRENQLPRSDPSVLVAEADVIDLTPFVTSVRTTKTKSAPNGTWKVDCTFEGLQSVMPALADLRSLNRVVVPQNFVQIAFDAGTRGNELTVVMQGPVTRVFSRESVGRDGQPQREITLAGEDWGNLLVRHEIPAHQFTAYIQGQGELLARQGFGAILAGTVGDVNQKAFDAIFRAQVSELQLALQNLYAIDIDAGLFEPRAGYTWLDTIWHRQGKFWTTLRSLADEPWNELYADFYPQWVPQGPGDGLRLIPPGENPDQERPAFVIRLRHTPFDKERWDVLPTHVIRDDELIYADSALADDERVNWVLVELSQLANNTEHSVDLMGYMIRRFDKVDAERHGARLLRVPTAYVDLPAGRSGESIVRDPDEQDRFMRQEGDLYALADHRGEFVWNAFSINHRLHRASWVIAGRPEIRIGDRVENQRDPSSYFVDEEHERRTYYVEQVVHDYRQDAGRFFTHLGLTRGQKIDTFVTPWTDGKGTEAAA